MSHGYYSDRNGEVKETHFIDLYQLMIFFKRIYIDFEDKGYFQQCFGKYCPDGYITGLIDPEFEILHKIRKASLWPIDKNIINYSETDLFDIIEFLYLYISKPLEGRPHEYGGCGIHWYKFNEEDGKAEFKEKINELLSLYEKPFEFSVNGQILTKAEQGFEKLLKADIATDNPTISDRVNAAIIKFRHYASSENDRRHAIRDLADVLEYLRPYMRKAISKQDEADLFNIANNFGIRHLNDIQKTDYDEKLWFSWMFYHYLSTIHVILHKLNKIGINPNAKV